MAFQTSHRNFALTTNTTGAYMILPTDLNTSYVITNPGTTLQYYGFSANANETIAAPTPVASGTTATPTFGTPILPGQQVLVNKNINTTTPYVYGLSPSGASSLIVSLGSGS